MTQKQISAKYGKAVKLLAQAEESLLAAGDDVLHGRVQKARLATVKKWEKYWDAVK